MEIGNLFKKKFFDIKHAYKIYYLLSYLNFIENEVVIYIYIYIYVCVCVCVGVCVCVCVTVFIYVCVSI